MNTKVLFFSILLLLTPVLTEAAETNFFVVAHEDDWQLFMNPNAYKSLIGVDRKAIFIHTTAGDSGYLAGGTLGTPIPYYLAREEGSLRATRFIANSIVVDGINISLDPQLTTKTTITLNGHNLLRYYYKNTVSYFLRLPDGGIQGIGFNKGAGNYQSLRRLYEGGESQIDAIDGSTSYKGWNDFVNTLKAIVQFESYRSSLITFNINDPDATKNPADHSDHIHTAMAMQQIVKLKPCVNQTLFLGYSTIAKPVNLSGDDLSTTIGTWAVTTSGLTDNYHHSTWANDHNDWINKSYFRSINSNANCAVTAINLASQATASASSETAGQTADKAIDGVVSGWPTGNPKNEWATLHQGKGAYLTLTWTKPVTIGHVVLYDRPNVNDQITSAHLVFDNGKTVAIPILNKDGSATEISFTPTATKSLQLVVDTVSVYTSNVGLAEIKVF